MLDPLVRAEPIKLDVERIATMLPLGVHVTKADVLESWIDGMLCARLEAFVLSETLVNDTETARASVPVSWWDHLRADLRHAAWGIESSRRRSLALSLVDRLGTPKTKTLELSVTWRRAAMRPESMLTMPELGRPVYVERVTHDERWLR